MYGINATALLPINPQTYRKVSKSANGSLLSKKKKKMNSIDAIIVSRISFVSVSLYTTS